MDHQHTAIRLVTRRYHELQGLRLVLIGSAFAACFGTYALAGAPYADWGLIAVLVAAFAGVAPGMWWLDRYYRHRFGRIVRPHRSRTEWRVVAAAVASTVLNQLFGLGAVAAALLIAMPFAVWVGVRDWPLRAHHLVAGLVIATTMLFLITATAADRHVAEAWAFAMFGAAYVPVGLLDHRLLASVAGRGDPAALKSCATPGSE